MKHRTVFPVLVLIALLLFTGAALTGCCRPEIAVLTIYNRCPFPVTMTLNRRDDRSISIAAFSVEETEVWSPDPTYSISFFRRSDPENAYRQIHVTNQEMSVSGDRDQLCLSFSPNDVRVGDKAVPFIPASGNDFDMVFFLWMLLTLTVYALHYKWARGLLRIRPERDALTGTLLERASPSLRRHYAELIIISAAMAMLYIAAFPVLAAGSISSLSRMVFAAGLLGFSFYTNYKCREMRDTLLPNNG